MERKTGNKLRLGIFVTITMALFIVGIYFIGQRQQLFNDTFHISGIFKDIGGLQIGNNVRFSGINVGIVDDINQITDSTVQIDMLIDEKSRKFIKKDAKAVIGSDGLMGNKIVMITPGKSGKQQVVNNDIIETVKEVGMDDILAKVKVTMDNAANITGDLSALTNNILNGKGTIGKLFMDSTLALNLDKTLVSIKSSAGGLKQTMEAANHNFFLRGFFKKKKKEKEKEKQKEKQKEKKKH